MSGKINKISTCGVLTAIAITFSYVEYLIPIPVAVPGVKLGVANIAIIAVLYMIGNVEAVIVNLLRILIMGILFGNFYSFMFSLAGGLLSIVLMIVSKYTKKLSIIGVSIVGAVTHNIGQIIMAVFLLNTPQIAYYLPILMIVGVFTGICNGFIAKKI
ncbi:MAG: Gx transporter family protein, partial [Lacrimispora sphenoides]